MSQRVVAYVVVLKSLRNSPNTILSDDPSERKNLDLQVLFLEGVVGPVVVSQVQFLESAISRNNFIVFLRQ